MLRKASKSLKNAKYWIKLSRNFSLLAIVINLVQVFIMEYYTLHKDEDDSYAHKEALSCSSPIWLINNCLYMLLVEIFVIFVNILGKKIKS